MLPAVPFEDLDTQPDPTVNGIHSLNLSSFNCMALTQFAPDGETLSDAHFLAAETPEQLERNSHSEDEESSMYPIVHPLRLTSEQPTSEAVGAPSNTNTFSGSKVLRQGTAQYQTMLSFGSGSAEQPIATNQRTKSLKDRLGKKRE
ncbi:hypothetical protein GYMLUDRAFT_248752 [Collybiopsis luxurians FD-317 M1]|uniref:Unplaced genomic scaffold GYMLUscaffold_59, whole genome shotgun sequence n=1 Tax=Collybiopsis luxurians FD-317 M1 TaxID=944289 RepID=A0A0D0CBB7_9AGAR|nr:hypothetical protein GYMLUDRAFT_248752 [Collybiopsis luxurians FD-317 M1]